ncbi:MAG: metalloregulator ArsR/SmtB family transcription factor [Balneolaceae bacterium]
MQRDVFQAIADSTRREIIHLVADKSLSINDVADNFEISRPAISKHIKILNECGLILIRKKGRKRYCQADLSKLKKVSDWAEQYKKFWSGRLDKLETLLSEEDQQK